MLPTENYCVLDLETNIKNTGVGAIGDHKAAPWHPDNNIVIGGWKWPNMEEVLFTYGNVFPMHMSLFKPAYLVGHNIKFDLMYLMSKVKFPAHEFKIWDTQLAEYLLTGQNKLYPSLDYCSEKYGGTLKDSRIKDYWAAGVDTADIPPDQLKEYLGHDVLNTELVFKAQVAKAQKLGMMDLMLSQMEALLATTEMEFNGLNFNSAYAVEEIERLEVEKVALEGALNSIFADVFEDSVEPNVYSAQQLSVVLFGGPVKYTYDQVIMQDGQPVLYKTGPKIGQVKTRKASGKKILKGLGVTPDKEWASKSAGIFLTNDDVLKQVQRHPSLAVQELVGAILKLRGIKKDHTTYFVGYSELVWPDGCIHHGLNHTSTGTGRLSCNRPNLQNVSSGE